MSTGAVCGPLEDKLPLLPRDVLLLPADELKLPLLPRDVLLAKLPADDKLPLLPRKVLLVVVDTLPVLPRDLKFSG